MAVAWTITGPDGTQPLDYYKLTLIGGEFVQQGADSVELASARDYDADDVWAYEEAVTLYRDGVPYFYGEVTQTPRSGSAHHESHSYIITGPFRHFGRTYHQTWAWGSGSMDTTQVVLGKDELGADMTTMQTVEMIIDYVIAQGAPIQKGSISAGVQVWPVELKNVTCEEAMRTALRFHPQAQVWFDYSTSPPTINVQERADMAAVSLPHADKPVASTNIVRRDDLVPECVAITYETSHQVDGEMYRALEQDIWPAAKTGKELTALSALVPLEGMQQQTNKQRVKTAAIPGNLTELQTLDGAKFFLRHFPELSELIDLSNLNNSLVRFSGLYRQVLSEDGADEPDPINPNAPEITPAATPDDLPNELLEGSVEDWMRKKSGQLRVSFGVRPRTTPALSQAQIERVVELLGPYPDISAPTADDEPSPLSVNVRATDAVTKLYKGVNFWKPADEAPTGIAQGVYENLSNPHFQGSWAIIERDVGGTRYHGKKLNITGGRAEWATMNAVIQSVSWDVASGATTISFGPPDHLGPQDLIELQRMMRTNPVTWWSVDERTSNRYSAEANAGTRGDVVGGYNMPKTTKGKTSPVSYGKSTLTPHHFERDETDIYVILNPCKMPMHVTPGASSTADVKYGADSLDTYPRIPVSTSTTLWAKWETTKNGAYKSDVEVMVTEPTGAKPHIPGSPSGSSQDGVYKQKIATVDATIVSDKLKVDWKPHSPGLFWSVFDRDLESGSGADADVAQTVTSSAIKLRGISGTGGTEPSGTGVQDLWIKVEEDGDIIKITGKVDIPPCDCCSGTTNTPGP